MQSVNRPALPVDRIKIDEHRELRLISGLWYELRMAPIPEARYRVVRESTRIPHRGRRGRGNSLPEIETDVRRLISPPVYDFATGRLINVGPVTDDPASWNWYRREQPERCYAAAKRALSRRELRRHAIENQSDDEWL